MQRTVHQVDATGALGVDAVAQRHRLLDRARHVGERTLAHVRRQRVEQQVDSDTGLGRGELDRRCAQAGDGLDLATARRWEPAPQLLAADPLDPVIGGGMVNDDDVGAIEQATGGRRHAGVEDGVGGEAQAPARGWPGPVRAGSPVPTSALPTPGRLVGR